MQLNRILATLAIVACAAAISAPAFAGNHSGTGAAGPSQRQSEHGVSGRNVEREQKGGFERETAEREHDSDGKRTSRNMNGPAGSSPVATPLSKLGTAPASTLKTVPVSALGSTMVAVPASSLSTMTPSALAPTSPPAPVTVTQPASPPAPVIDGAALYNSLCSGCHGSGKRGRPAASTQAAISGNLGGMGSLSYLTPAQLQAIAAY